MRLATTIAKIGMACAVLAAVSASAQTSDNSPTAPRAHIDQVTDQKTDDQSPGCTVNIYFTGRGVEHALCTRNLRIDEAVDDLGNDLKTTEQAPGEVDYGIFAHHHGLWNHAPFLEILLKNPPRKAATIKELKGDVQLFTPTKVNGGQVTLPDFSSAAEKPMNDPILEKYQIQLFNLTPQDFEGFKKNQRKAILNAARKAGLTEEDIRNLKKDVHNGSFLISPESGRMLLFYRKDPEDMIVQARFRDASGHWIQNVEWDEVDDNLSLLVFDKELSPKTDLVLDLAVPDAVKDCPFDFHDVPLP